MPFVNAEGDARFQRARMLSARCHVATGTQRQKPHGGIPSMLARETCPGEEALRFYEAVSQSPLGPSVR